MKWGASVVSKMFYFLKKRDNGEIIKVNISENQWKNPLTIDILLYFF